MEVIHNRLRLERKINSFVADRQRSLILFRSFDGGGLLAEGKGATEAHDRENEGSVLIYLRSSKALRKFGKAFVIARRPDAFPNDTIVISAGARRL